MLSFITVLFLFLTCLFAFIILNYNKILSQIYLNAINDYIQLNNLSVEQRNIIIQVFVLKSPEQFIQMLNQGRIGQQHINNAKLLCQDVVKYFANDQIIGGDIFYNFHYFFDALMDNIDFTFAVVVFETADLRLQQTPQQQIDQLMLENDEQNVHQSSVINTSKNILNRSSKTYQHIRSKDISKLISSVQQIDEKCKKLAVKVAKYIYKENQFISPYNMGEKQILQIVVANLQEIRSDEQNVFFVQQLIEMVQQENDRFIIQLCPTGRAVRLIDVLTFNLGEKILPDYVIKQKVLDQLQLIQQEVNVDGLDEMQVKSQLDKRFQEYLDAELLQKGVIDRQKRDEFASWVHHV